VFNIMTRLQDRYSSGAREFPPKRPHRLWGSRSFFIKLVTEVILLEIKRPGRGANHSPSDIAEVKNERICASFPLYHYVVSRDNFRGYFLAVSMASFKPVLFFVRTLISGHIKV